MTDTALLSIQSGLGSAAASAKTATSGLLGQAQVYGAQALGIAGTLATSVLDYFSGMGASVEAAVPASLDGVAGTISPYIRPTTLLGSGLFGLVNGIKNGYNRHERLTGIVRSGVEDVVTYTGAGALGAGLIGTVGSMIGGTALAASLPAGIALATAVLPYAMAAGAVYTAARGVGSIVRGVKNYFLADARRERKEKGGLFKRIRKPKE